MEAKSPVSLTDQEITHVELNLKNASQESLSNDMSRHCKEKLTAGILGLLCLKVTMMVTVTITISPSVIHLENNSSLARTQKEVHNLSSAYHCGRCPNEWLIFSNNCYYFGVEKKNWTESLASCTSKKSNLIYIDDEKEMKFLRFSRSSWIGVSRSSRDHPWLSSKALII
ncbi:NKG2-A/NKG2-B type II integral membrane protein-like isoform X2 [Cavia porcellus]|uniref:NKG2-A/NKG2-B type II integral membrane protein-like isoform X2 n=1 Tax=Cavia porcellus TaxID=10141 RepID=UPI000661A6FB|nr:NKG2-A/NKG2-B type II integral membrane protein-like isoform X2 [Cavia porcellus]